MTTQFTQNSNLYKWQTTDTKQTTITEMANNADKIDTHLGYLFTMRDPLAYLNSVKILCSFPARGQSTTAWIQGFSINETTNEIYIAIQENSGTYLTIEIRNMDGTFKESKTLTIDSGAYTESLPFFYNVNSELCFVVRTQATATYAIYNYTTGVLGSPIAINGTPYKCSVDGSFFITCDATSSAPYTIKTIYVYDWYGIQSGSPSLLNSFRLDGLGGLTQKPQGIVLNNGYIFVIQGESGGSPGIVIYNTAGQLVNNFIYTKESLASAVNIFSPGAISDLSGYAYENESGCKYKGKLASAQILNGVAYIAVHNTPSGTHLETKVPIYEFDTGWLTNITLLNGATAYASDTTPRIRRIGNQVILSGAIKGFTTLNQDFIQFDSSLAPDRNFQKVEATSNGKTANWQVQPAGTARILTSMNSPLATTDWYPFHIKWFI